MQFLGGQAQFGYFASVKVGDEPIAGDELIFALPKEAATGQKADQQDAALGLGGDESIGPSKSLLHCTLLMARFCQAGVTPLEQ